MLHLYMDRIKKQLADKKIYLLIVTILFSIFLIVLIGLAVNKSRQFRHNTQTAADFHIHAAFQIYIDGKLQDFSDYKYMHFKPCIAGENETDYTDVREKVHLHDNIGDVAHIHYHGVTWQDLLLSLGLSKYLKIQPRYLYLDGVLTADLLTNEIDEYQLAVMAFGKDIPQVTMQNQSKHIDQAYFEKVESSIESCGK